MRKSQILTALGAVAAAPALLAFTASPASALASASLQPSNCGAWYNQTCAGYAQDVPGVGASGTDVEVSCSATGTQYDATVVQCYIEGNNGDTHWTDPVLTQGGASTLTFRFGAWTLSSRAYRVCVGAGFFDSSYGYVAPDNFTCGSVV